MCVPIAQRSCARIISRILFPCPLFSCWVILHFPVHPDTFRCSGQLKSTPNITHSDFSLFAGVSWAGELCRLPLVSWFFLCEVCRLWRRKCYILDQRFSPILQLVSLFQRVLGLWPCRPFCLTALWPLLPPDCTQENHDSPTRNHSRLLTISVYDKLYTYTSPFSYTVPKHYPP